MQQSWQQPTPPQQQHANARNASSVATKPQHVQQQAPAVRHAAIIDAYNTSTFCLQPPGDTPTRKGVVDSLLLGCIPVLFDPLQREQWPWHWGSWAPNASVLLNGTVASSGRLDVFDALRAIPAARVRAMQEAIRAHAHVMQYATTETAVMHAMHVVSARFEDAFDVLIRRAWERSRSHKLQEAGARAQARARRSVNYRHWSQATHQSVD
eukprot:5022935-Prymnesium_polylepis.1